MLVRKMFLRSDLGVFCTIFKTRRYLRNSNYSNLIIIETLLQNYILCRNYFKFA